MKKGIAALLVCLLMCLCAAALAEEAEDITETCSFSASNGYFKYTMMTDRKYTSHWRIKDEQRHPWVVIEAPKATPIYGLYVCFAQMPDSYEIQVQQGGQWVTYCEGDTSYYHMYQPIPEGAEAVRLYVTQETRFQLDINEIFVLGQGEIPDWVQRWEPTPTQCDLLLAACHPDDDLIFFCGAIPTYAIEQGRSVAVCYYSYSNTTRRSELLNALWSMGYRKYPIVGTFPDRSQKKLADCYKTAGGEKKVVAYYVDVIQKTRPQVIVTHDVNGEYGHGQHAMVADAVQQAYDKAAEGENGWQAQKLYLHLGKENQITVDWDVPLPSYGGQTGRELAIEAFTYHVTQKNTKYDVATTGVEYDNELFGLARTEVGEDVTKNDFLEHITPVVVEATTPVPAQPEAIAVPAVSDAPAVPDEPDASNEPTASDVPTTAEASAATETSAPTNPPAPTEAPTVALSEEFESLLVMPELNTRGYLDEGEFVYASDTEGLYVFVNQTSRVIIQRKYDEVEKLEWFDAEIWCDTEAGEYLKTYPYNEKNLNETADIEKTAQKNKLAFAMNTDYYVYRRGGTRPMGLVIRDGKILYEKPYKAATKNFPNLDTLAFYPDGSMEVNESWEVTGEEYLARGAVNVYSFGPILLENGEYNQWVLDRKDSEQPRCAIGMVEPGHYICILCTGRLKRSEGVSLNQLMVMMKDRGCTLAINLDGGQTAAMTFMGKRINEIGKYKSGEKMLTSPRRTTEVLGIGISNPVGTVEFK